jgi:nicotinamidase-related amidase
MKCALLVIDVQKAIFEMKQPVYAQTDFIKNIKLAVSYSRANGIKIIFSLHENKSFLKKGTEGHEIVDDINVLKDDIILAKKHPNVFLETGLNSILKEEGIDTVIIAGLISNGCVKEACLSALKHGYGVCLLSDAHSTFYKNGKKIVEDINREMAAAGICVKPVEQLPTLCN